MLPASTKTLPVLFDAFTVLLIDVVLTISSSALVHPCLALGTLRPLWKSFGPKLMVHSALLLLGVLLLMMCQLLLSPQPCLKSLAYCPILLKCFVFVPSVSGPWTASRLSFKLGNQESILQLTASAAGCHGAHSVNPVLSLVPAMGAASISIHYFNLGSLVYGR
jgi:hypothetical protein